MNKELGDIGDLEFDALKNAAPENKRAAFLEYCRKNIGREGRGEQSIQAAAYNICGASLVVTEQVSTEFAEGLLPGKMDPVPSV